MHAIDRISDGHFDDGIRDLRDFVDRFPEHVYADYAHYWLAYAQYQRHEYALGEVTSDFLLYRYPYSFKHGDALILNALCRWQRGDRGRAGEELKGLLEKYPRADLARVAEGVLFGESARGMRH